MKPTLNADEKHMLSVAVSKIHSTVALLEPMTSRSLLVAKAQVRLREANVLIALAVYEKPEEKPNAISIFS
jgi:hypothetical protein